MSHSVQTKRILYTASPFAREDLLHLQETGILKAVKRHASERSNLSSYLFFVVLDGSGSLFYDGNLYSLKKGDCVFIDCKKNYSHMTSEDLWTLKWAHFDGSNMKGIYSKYVSRGGRPVFHPNDPTLYEMHLDTLFALAESDDYIRDMKINACLSELLVDLMDISWSSENLSSVESSNLGKKSVVKDVKDYLTENYLAFTSLDDLSNRFYISKFYLVKLFKEQYGVSILEYINTLKITKAKELLRFTDASIDKVAEESGFESQNYFARMFRKTEGITPSNYRKQW